MQKKGDSLRYPSPKNSPVDCFSPMSGSAQSNLFPFHIKKESPQKWRLFFGGKRGIRTLGAFIGHTRFPVVRLRPAQPSLRGAYLSYRKTGHLSRESTVFFRFVCRAAAHSRTFRSGRKTYTSCTNICAKARCPSAHSFKKASREPAAPSFVKSFLSHRPVPFGYFAPLR